MHSEVFGLIYAEEDSFELRELTRERSVASLPIGGRYRVIDFILSSMVNAGVRNVGVITFKNYKSLMDHLGSGKDWDLARKEGGLSILPPFDRVATRGMYQGLCDAVYSKLDFIRDAPQDICLLSDAMTIFSYDLSELFELHKENGADISMLYTKNGNRSGHPENSGLCLHTDGAGRVTDMERITPQPGSTDKLSLGLYLISKTLLEELVVGACSRGKYDFVTDILVPNLKRLRIFAYEQKGYIGRIDSLTAYFNTNMDMITPKVRHDLFERGQTVYTKIMDEPPAVYTDTATVRNCIVGDGCKISGAVENSVLFRGVRIGRGATVRNCIIMQDSEVRDGCTLENVIIDKNAEIRENVRLIGVPSLPVVVRKGAVI